jgi:hypothetical protein
LFAKNVLILVSAMEQIKQQFSKATGEVQILALNLFNVLSLIHACKIIWNFNNFRGGIDSLCDIGYTGRMCNICEEKLINGAFYARSGPSKCTKCSSLTL